MSFLTNLQASIGSRCFSVCGVILLLCLTTNVARAGPVELSHQTVTLPVNTSEPIFVDIDEDGRADLLVLDPVEKKLLNYHQHSNGFSNSPDQTISLPPQTAWVAACDVHAHAGRELLFSTAVGLIYSRQNAGLIESERHTLIESMQVFSNFDFPILIRLSTNKTETNILIPVISADHVVRYHRNSAYEWSPEAPLALDTNHTSWSVNNSWPQWTSGPNPARSLTVWQSIQSKQNKHPEDEPANDAIRKIRRDFKPGYSGENRLDINGDGQEDLILRNASSGKLDVKTDLHVFLRGVDRKLPEKPTQVLHCLGFPIPIGYNVSPVSDLDGDGVGELVLLELKSNFTSVSGAIETALSHGVDWALTIRSFKQGAFSRSPDASFPVTGILAVGGGLEEWPMFIQGDFNGDGRPDLLFRRSETHWNIFFSTSDGRWFATQPAMTFEAPARVYIDIKDLNGDGLADIICHEPDESRYLIFMSPPRGTKDKNP